MIRNKLSILLAERGIKATKVANDTGIARSTLSKITNNSSEKIDYSTINTLCRYLKITPCDFFEYEPFDVSFFVSIEPSTTPIEEGPPCYPIEAFLNIEDDDGKHSIEYKGFIEEVGWATRTELIIAGHLEPASEQDVKLVDLYLSDVNQTFITDIMREFKKATMNSAQKTLSYFNSDTIHSESVITLNLFNKKKTN
ncbi:helix-turn-helix transcriptional regulator [Enterococcus faecium]|nr:helix-turn-helix transcriptional regulator [Enterococcus faecium]